MRFKLAFIITRFASKLMDWAGEISVEGYTEAVLSDTLPGMPKE